MATITAHELAYLFESHVLRRLRSAKVPRAKALVDDIVPELMRDVPTEAFEPEPNWKRGLLFFHGDVTEEYVSAMQEELAAIHGNIKPGIRMNLCLSSFGGSCEAGMAFFSTIQDIRRAGRAVDCHIQGVAMSMGSIIAQACDVRTIEPFAFFMLHEISGPVEGKTSDLRDAVTFHERYEQAIFATYSARTGKPVDYWREKMRRRDWYLSAREAVAEGLVDRIRPIPGFKVRQRKGAAAKG